MLTGNKLEGGTKNDKIGKRKVPRWMESMEVKARKNNKSEEPAACRWKKDYKRKGKGRRLRFCLDMVTKDGI